jgi:hypothetical protein
MRFRFATSADYPACQSMIDRGTVASRKIQEHIPQCWTEMLAINPGSITVIEDPEVPHPDGIEAFGVCAFVGDAFLDEFLAAPRPYLPTVIYERMLQGESPLLAPAAVRNANSGPGLNLVCLHFALRNRDLNHPRTRQALQVSNASFFFFFGGYRINRLYQEVYGAQHAAYLTAGGLRQIADFSGHVARDSPPCADEVRPFLFGLRKDEIEPAAVNPLSLLFHALPPRFAFSASAQRVLERAMLLYADDEIARDLHVSADAVKKTWRAIYQRVDNVAPRMFGAATRAANPSHRSAERRRHLLDYLRTHPEELRPVNVARNKAMSGARHQ